MSQATAKEIKALKKEWWPTLERLRLVGLSVHAYGPGVSYRHGNSTRTIHIEPVLLTILTDLIKKAHPETQDDKAMIKAHDAYKDEEAKRAAAEKKAPPRSQEDIRRDELDIRRDEFLKMQAEWGLADNGKARKKTKKKARKKTSRKAKA